jgi:1-deoxy-D-xylulose-5-phosphate synthase
MVAVATSAAQELAARGIDAGVVNARYAKPLDLELLRSLARETPRILTLEEHLGMGGFGSAVLEAFHRNGLEASGLRVHAIPDMFVEHSPQAIQRANLKLDLPGVVETVLRLYPELAANAGGARARGKSDEEKLVETVTW